MIITSKEEYFLYRFQYFHIVFVFLLIRLIIKLIFICRLVNNPVCQETGVARTYCSISKSNDSYTTPPNNCVPVSCSSDQILSPNCKCAYPYTGTLTFRATSFSETGNETIFANLGFSLMQSFQLYDKPVDSVSLSNPRRGSVQYLDLTLQVFPSGQDHFNRTGISGIAFMLSNQTYKPPKMFGPYYFIGDTYEHFVDDSGKLDSTYTVMNSL